ncbi:hypothetical protein ACJX0J_030457 [Zea mays]
MQYIFLCCYVVMHFNAYVSQSKLMMKNLTFVVWNEFMRVKHNYSWNKASLWLERYYITTIFEGTLDTVHMFKQIGKIVGYIADLDCIFIVIEYFTCLVPVIRYYSKQALASHQ